MTAAKTGKTSPMAEFFCNASPETKRGVFKNVISKAIASQRDVVEKAEAIKNAHKTEKTSAYSDRETDEKAQLSKVS
ncbi:MULTISPECIES: hypothetical protein [Pseudomonas]|jgi:hypothetical protein|uniref:hypothetical protein n=1 Tax=Pseudomonas TaxID=286 RepID=UPI000FB7B114|nr:MULTISPECIES: hypothetical protein [Pseudomonas]MDD2102067.1 hypothetical protein [Pseudomonas putida]MEB2621552.1 hypothetical protein [Pseudomonas sp. YuFO8]